MPEELKISDNISLDVEELTSNKEINKNITLENDTTKGNNKLIFIIVLGIVVLLAFVVTFLIFKNRNKTIASLLATAILGSLLVPYSVNAETINKSFKISDSFVMNNTTYDYTNLSNINDNNKFFKVTKLIDGIPADDKSKMVFMELLLFNNIFYKKSNATLSSDKKYCLVNTDDVESYLQQFIGFGIDDFNNIDCYPLVDKKIGFPSGNRGTNY